jgi:hypothetical protein
VSQMKLNIEMKVRTLGAGKLIYVPRWADDADMLYRESKMMPFTPEIVPKFSTTVEIKKRKTVDFGLEYAYSRTAKKSIPWEPRALAIKQKLESQIGVTLQTGRAVPLAQWGRAIVSQCRALEVPCFVKQIGTRPVCDWQSRCADGFQRWRPRRVAGRP